ncbi:Uncharacterized protein HZ326_9468 [Fusarium oxysporum f. sp. albedinis]|nr:Uncharacterized protein HZ326_9468 [Fusarium oxysporum f. sp. albedinis]
MVWNSYDETALEQSLCQWRRTPFASNSTFHRPKTKPLFPILRIRFFLLSITLYGQEICPIGPLAVDGNELAPFGMLCDSQNDRKK